VKAILTGWLRSASTQGQKILWLAGHMDKPEMFLKIEQSPLAIFFNAGELLTRDEI
jgi:hypothetical protein